MTAHVLPPAARQVIAAVYEDLPHALRHARTLTALIGTVGDLVAQQHPDHPYQRRAASTRARQPLTPTQRRILPLMAEGCTNVEIGQRLGVSLDTVKTHAQRMYQALGARGREHAVAIAIRAGLLRLDAA